MRKNGIRNFHYLGFLPILLFSMILQFGCGSILLESTWKEKTIYIDGKSSEWLGHLYYFDDKKISLGLMNDESFCYICMITENRFLRPQMIGSGFTVWFDPAGGRKQVIGLQFPVGMAKKQDRTYPLDQGMRISSSRLGGEEMEMVSRFPNQAVIFDSREGIEKKFFIDELPGIEIFLDVTGGFFVYELKIPLISNEIYPYALGAAAGETIGLGLEIPKANRDSMRGGVGRSGGLGDQGSMRNRRRGRSGVMKQNFPRGLKVWSWVQLADKPADSTIE